MLAVEWIILTPALTLPVSSDPTLFRAPSTTSRLASTTLRATWDREKLAKYSAHLLDTVVTKVLTEL